MFAYRQPGIDIKEKSSNKEIDTALSLMHFIVEVNRALNDPSDEHFS